MESESVTESEFLIKIRCPFELRERERSGPIQMRAEIDHKDTTVATTIFMDVTMDITMDVTMDVAVDIAWPWP